MKFTEEQFKKLVEIQEDQYISSLSYRSASFGRVIIDVVNEFDDDLGSFIVVNRLGNEAVALMNPLTRKWAHEQYVEEEKRYFWSTKKKSKKGKPMTLFKSAGGIAQMTGQKHALTESEIREWGFNPERFDKEEVE